MRAVLGIDAAWTSTQPSGVALVAETPSGWRLIAAAASYQQFVAMAGGHLGGEPRPSGSLPRADLLLEAAAALSGHRVDLVAIDMPLSYAPIAGRRAADNAVSRTYGSRKAGTHTPSAVRPGTISDRLRVDFDRCGFPLRTLELKSPGLIEVYPHPALIELASAPERLPYKASKTRTYWPTAALLERKANLRVEWAKILARLEGKIAGVEAALPGIGHDVPGWRIKAYEDQLDAVVCAWVAVCALDGRARPFGNAEAAIWIPTPGEVPFRGVTN